VQRTSLLVIFLLVLATGFMSFAQENAQTRALDAEIARSQEILKQQQDAIAQLERELANISSEIQETVRERDRISQRLAELRQEREVLQRDIEVLEAQLLETQAEIVLRQENIAALEERIQGLLLNLHRQRAGRYARVLAQAETFHDLEVKNYYLSLLTQQDVALINQLADEVAALAEAQERQVRQKQDLEATEAQLADTERQLETTLAEHTQTISRLQATQEGRQALRRERLGEQQDLQATIARAAREREKLIRQLQAEAMELRRRAQEATLAREQERLRQQAVQAEQRAQALAEPPPAATVEQPTTGSSTQPTPTPVATAGGEFAHPFPNPRLLSGYSADQIYVVLQAERDGSAVQAVLDGVVQYAQFHSANSGYAVMISHNSGLSTIYQNLQQPSVRPGDRVTQGQVIGALGGGSLFRSDMLVFFVGIPRGSSISFVDPAPRLGFR
jgi:septal ring factor EnvC (AmiA/AmiB activator)